MTKLTFPEGFLWGAATSSHQVEGGNHNDWSEWEKQNADRLARESEKTFAWNPHWKKFEKEATDPENYISGAACDHWNRYEEDFDILKNMHCNAYRFSIEWSRVEPEEGKFDEQAIAHYRKMLEALRTRRIVPFVTLWHWTNPLWIETGYGGWENPAVGEKFYAFAERVVTEFQDLISFWAIFNEPNTFVGHGYIQANRVPMRKSYLRANRAFKTFMLTHKKVYNMIHRIQPQAEVGVSHFLVYMQPHDNRLINKLAVKILDYIRNWRFFNSLDGYFDFAGVQFYRVESINVSWRGTWGPVSRVPIGKWQNDMGWDLEPEAIHVLLHKIYKYKKPIYITENGLADRDDISRPQFIQKTLAALHEAIKHGIPVKGYFHWSLLDNFEWSEGYWPRFGLVAVDFATQKRTLRPSALAYAKICKENALEVENP